MTDTQTGHSIWWKVGIALLLINVPFGLGALALCGVLAATLHDAGWLIVGAAAYVTSWLMLGLGIFLAGPGSIKYAKEMWRRWVHRTKTPHQDSPPSSSSNT